MIPGTFRAASQASSTGPRLRTRRNSSTTATPFKTGHQQQQPPQQPQPPPPPPQQQQQSGDDAPRCPSRCRCSCSRRRSPAGARAAGQASHGRTWDLGMVETTPVNVRGCLLPKEMASSSRATAVRAVWATAARWTSRRQTTLASSTSSRGRLWASASETARAWAVRCTTARPRWCTSTPPSARPARS